MVGGSGTTRGDKFQGAERVTLWCKVWKAISSGGNGRNVSTMRKVWDVTSIIRENKRKKERKKESVD